MNSTGPVPIWRDRNLLGQLVRRDIEARYRGSLLGIIWSFLTPLVMLGVYTFVFGYIFQSKWDTASLRGAPFALVLFAGMMIFAVFSETLSRASSVVISNPNYIKRVVFPLEILPVTVLGASLVNLGISFAIFMLAYLIAVGAPSIEIFFLPVLLLPLILFTLGLAWLLASLGVFLRDISQIVPLFITALMFLSPVFYPASAIPQGIKALYSFNLVGHAIENSRVLLFESKLPDFSEFGFDLLISSIFFCLGYIWFQKSRKGFADVI